MGECLCAAVLLFPGSETRNSVIYTVIFRFATHLIKASVKSPALGSDELTRVPYTQ